jgi:hypothetical protein
VASGQTVDLPGGRVRDGVALIEWPHTAGRNQLWRPIPAGSGERYRMASLVDERHCLGRQEGTARVVLRRCGQAGTDWELEALAGQAHRLRDPAGGYLSVAAARAVRGRELTVSPHAWPDASWYLTPADFRPPAPGEDPRLDEVTFLTAHNAFLNQRDAFWFAPNQSLSVAGQLAAGVRGFMLDVHGRGSQVHLCHTDEPHCGWAPGVHHGVPRQRLAPVLQTIVDFLSRPEGRTEVAAVFLEDYVAADDLRRVLGEVRGLDRVLFDPDDFQVRTRGWPRVSEMVASGRRLLVFSDRNGWDSSGVMNGHEYTVENHWSMGLFGADTECRSRWSDVPLHREEPGFRRLFVLNHFRDVPSRWAGEADNGAKLRWRTSAVCGPAARRAPNFLAVDYLQHPAGDPPAALVAELNGCRSPSGPGPRVRC